MPVRISIISQYTIDYHIQDEVNQLNQRRCNTGHTVERLQGHVLFDNDLLFLLLFSHRYLIDILWIATSP